MRIRQTVLAVLAAGAFTAGSAVVGAGPASAATTATTVTCLTAENQIVAVAVTVRPGDVLVYDRTAPCDRFGVRPYGSQSADTPPTAGTIEFQREPGAVWEVTTTSFFGPLDWRLRYTAPSDGTTSDSFYVIAAATNGDGLAGYLVTVTISDSASASAAAPSPAPWIQQYGRANAEAQCEPDWAASWSQWPNDGTGGWVCTRTLAYNNATGLWDAS